jgi:hypothetical protein
MTNRQSYRAYRDYHQRMWGALPDTPRGWSALSIIWRAAVIITVIAMGARYWP